MIHHVQNTLSNAISTPSKSAVSEAATDSFKSALSDASASDTAASSGPPDGGYDPFLQAAYDYNLTHPATATTSAATTSTATTSTPTPSNQDMQQAFDNAYWAAQPAPVQALRNVQDPAERMALATELADQGYSIDVPIMAWGWDPSKVTSMREADGYTWVPSALQSPVEMAPGLPAMGGIAAYNPNNPPPGSIAV